MSKKTTNTTQETRLANTPLVQELPLSEATGIFLLQLVLFKLLLIKDQLLSLLTLPTGANIKAEFSQTVELQSIMPLSLLDITLTNGSSETPGVNDGEKTVR